MLVSLEVRLEIVKIRNSSGSTFYNAIETHTDETIHFLVYVGDGAITVLLSDNTIKQLLTYTRDEIINFKIYSQKTIDNYMLEKFDKIDVTTIPIIFPEKINI